MGDDPVPDDLAELAEHTSAREREAARLEYLADEICLAWLLEDRLRERGWEEPWEGEIIGLIGAGLFARFGEVFEGFLPARRLPGEFFELNRTATALDGPPSGRTYRLGDPIEVRVESIVKGEGKVELLAGERSLARLSARASRRRRGGAGRITGRSASRPRRPLGTTRRPAPRAAHRRAPGDPSLAPTHPGPVPGSNACCDQIVPRTGRECVPTL